VQCFFTPADDIVGRRSSWKVVFPRRGRFQPDSDRIAQKNFYVTANLNQIIII
jgi:hypothetical protein